VTTWRRARTSRRYEKPSQETPTWSRAERLDPHVVIVDDALLLALLAEQEGISEALLITGAEDGEVFTTGRGTGGWPGSWPGLVGALYPVP
jgi:hypothetical protein